MSKLFPFYKIGHFINQPASETEFEITLFEDMEEPEVDDIHKHTFYEILWVDEGQSLQTIDYETYELNEQSLFFISPGQVHEFNEWRGLKGGTILFTGDFFLLNQQNKDKLFELTFLDNIYSKPNLKLSHDSYAEIRHTIGLMIGEKNRRDCSSMILQSLLQLLLLQIQRNIDKRAAKIISKRYALIYKRFLQLVETNFKSGWTAADYAAALDVAQRHLYRAVKEASGKTLSEAIRARSVLEAKRMLTFSDATVGEIAMELGYFDHSYFAKIFRQETGCSPLAFRDAMSEKYPNK